MPPKSRQAAKALPVVALPEGGYPTVSPQLINHRLNRQHDAEILASVLGYAMYDFVNWPPPAFGAWNARELDTPHVTKIEKGYRYIGIDNISVLTAIFLVLDPALINTTALVQDKDLNNEVPLIEWLVEPVPMTKAASGHHRFTALMRFRQALEDEIVSIETTIQALLASKKAESADTAKKIEMLQLRKPIVQGELDNVGRWLVRIHDASKLSPGALDRLSENLDKPVLASTDEEALVSALYSLISIKDHPNFVPATFAKSITQEGRKHATTQTKMATLFYNIPLIEILVDLLRWGGHFRSASIYRVKYLASKVVGTSCGVLVTVLKMFNDNLCRLLIPIDQPFQLELDGVDLLVDVSSMRKFLEMGRDAALRAKANMSIDEWQKHFDRLKEVVNIDPSGHPINYFLLQPFLAAFDEAAEEELGKAFEARGFLKDAPDMNLRVALYLEAVLTKITPLLKSATFPGATQMASKITLMCYAHDDTQAAYPLLSLFIITTLAEALATYPNALMEISRWFEPLIDYLLGKTSGMSSNDFTTEAIAAIKLNKNWLVGADIKFALCVLGWRMPLLEGLEAELTRYLVRIVNKNTYSDALATQAMDRSESARNAILRKASLPFKEKVATIVSAMQKASQPSFKFKRATPNDSFKGTTIENMECALPLRNSFIPWLQITGKSQSRESPVIAAASMYEWYTTGEYRRDLLLSQGGLMRGRFLEDMGDSMNRLRLITVDGTSFLPWWDGIYVVPAVIKSDKDNTKVVAAGKLANTLSKDLQSIFLKVSTSPAAQLVSGRIVLAKGKKAPMDAAVHIKLIELMKVLEVNVARSVRRAEMGNNTPFFLDQDKPAHRSWVPTVAPVSDMDTFSEYPKDGNVSALVATRVTAHLQTTLDNTSYTTGATPNSKGKAKAKPPVNRKRGIKSKSHVSSEGDDSSGSDIEQLDILKAMNASKLPVKLGSTSGVSEASQAPVAIVTRTAVDAINPPGSQVLKARLVEVYRSASEDDDKSDDGETASEDADKSDGETASEDADKSDDGETGLEDLDKADDGETGLEDLDKAAYYGGHHNNMDIEFDDAHYECTVMLQQYMKHPDEPIEAIYQRLRASDDPAHYNMSRSYFQHMFLIGNDEDDAPGDLHQPPGFASATDDAGNSGHTPTPDLEHLFAADENIVGSGQSEESEVDADTRPKACKELTKRQFEDLSAWRKKPTGKPAPQAIQKILKKEADYERWSQYLAACSTSRGSSKTTKRQREPTSPPKASRKKPTIMRRGGVDSDEMMEAVDDSTLVADSGHPV